MGHGAGSGAGRSIAKRGGGIAGRYRVCPCIAVTSLQLALAYPDPSGGVAVSLLRFGTVFAWTQIPIALAEGFLTAAAVRFFERQPTASGFRNGWEAAR